MSNIKVPKPSSASSEGRLPSLYGTFHDEMDRVFDRFFERGLPRWPSLFSGMGEAAPMVANLDVSENTNAVTVKADLPGVEEKDLSVTIANGLLTIKGEKKREHEEKKENYYLSERSFGSFERSIRLPETIDESKVEARFDKGVLKVTAAKKPEAVKAEKKIEIKKG